MKRGDSPMYHSLICNTIKNKINNFFLSNLPVIVLEKYKGNRLIRREIEQLLHYVYTCSNTEKKNVNK